MPFSFPASPSVNQTSVQNGRTYQWDGYVWNLVANVSTHASTHASGGSDPITPSAIGAAETSHSHSAADVNSGTLDGARLEIHPFLLMGG